jgi:hypothetical protein
VYFGVASSVEQEAVIYAFLRYAYEEFAPLSTNPFKREYITASETYRSLPKERWVNKAKLPLIEEIIYAVERNEGTVIRPENVLLIDDSISKLNTTKVASGNKVKTYHVVGDYFNGLDNDKIECRVCTNKALYVTDDAARIPLCGKQCLIKYYSE